MVLLVNLFVFVFFYTFLTVLPIYTLQELGGTESQGGLLISLFLLSAIITRPFSGAIVERFGKKRMAIVSMALFALSSFLYMPIHNFSLLLGLRFFQGICLQNSCGQVTKLILQLIRSERCQTKLAE